jgi:hypothetical protein
MTAGTSSASSDTSRPLLTRQQPLLSYCVGNCGALFAGLATAYVALMRGGHITNLTIRTGDFIQYFGISRLILGGRGGAIYDPHELSRVEALLVYPLSMHHGVLPYLYPPYFALAVSPLSLLPYGGAYLLWLVLNCVLLIVTLFVLERYGGLSGRSSGLARLASICSLPIILTLALGQVSILIAALLVLCFFAARSGRDGVAGVALALALIKPPYVLPLLVVFLVQRRWRALSAFAATCLFLVLVPVPVLGLSINQEYTHLLVAATGWQGQSGSVFYHHVMIAGATYDPHVNQSFAGLAQLLLATPASRILTLGATAALLALLVRCAWRCSDIDLPFGLAVVAALLINPHVLVHDLTLLLLPIWIALHHRRQWPMGSHTGMPQGTHTGMPLLGWLLVTCYIFVTVGDPLSYLAPVQLSAIAMSALGVWLFFAADRVQPAAKRTTTASVTQVPAPGRIS